MNSWVIKLVKHREGYRFVILEPAKTRIEQGLCPICQKPKSEWTRRTDWTCCSKECTAQFSKNCIYFGWPDLRDKVIKRDHYRCVKCGHQPTRESLFQILSAEEMQKKKDKGKILDFRQEQQGNYKYFIATVKDTSKLIADHIHPIALGGDEWDIDNIQTLCEECNKLKTAQDIKEIAVLRLQEKNAAKGQKQLGQVMNQSA